MFLWCVADPGLQAGGGLSIQFIFAGDECVLAWTFEAGPDFTKPREMSLFARVAFRAVAMPREKSLLEEVPFGENVCFQEKCLLCIFRERWFSGRVSPQKQRHPRTSTSSIYHERWRLPAAGSLVQKPKPSRAHAAMSPRHSLKGTPTRRMAQCPYLLKISGCSVLKFRAIRPSSRLGS